MADGTPPSEPPSGATEIEVEAKHHYNKKPKHNLELEGIPEEMDIQDEGGADGPVESMVDNFWASKLFPEQCHVPSIYPQFYLGDDKEEKYEGIDELFHGQSDSEEHTPKFGPIVEISKESIPACSDSGAEP